MASILLKKYSEDHGFKPLSWVTFGLWLTIKNYTKDDSQLARLNVSRWYSYQLKSNFWG